jgi:hypothetical protein
MERITGLHRNLQAPILGRIENYCKRKDLPHLTSILVNEEDGVPVIFIRDSEVQTAK